MSGWRAWIVLAACVAWLPAQGTEQDPESARRRARRDLRKSQTEVEQMLDMKIRHDLGMVRELDASMVRSVDAPTTAFLDRMRAELSQNQSQLTRLRAKFEQTRALARELQEEVEAQKRKDKDAQFVAVPPANAPLDPVPRQPAVATGDPRSAVRPAPGVEPAPSKVGARLPDDAELGPLRAQINGSQDHQRVAQALFKAGQHLMDQAEALRERGLDEPARERDGRARELLARAIDELGPLLALEEPPFVSLFYLGRCRELMFRYSERYEGLSLSKSQRDYQQREQAVRDPFLQISARDVQKTGEAGQNEVLGRWGQAAKAAMEHFRWMNVHAGFDASNRIEQLTWPGEKRDREL